MTMPLLEFKGICKGFGSAETGKQVLDQISLKIYAGSSWGLVGGSGAGKTTLANLILGLEKPDQGQILFRGQDVNLFSKAERHLLHKEIQVIWQDPMMYLNPFLKVSQLMEEPLICFGGWPEPERRQKVLHYLDLVELDKGLLGKRPHELSGGQCQRVAMARAIICGPTLVILDEALSGLDADLQARILDLLKRLKQEKEFSYLFISHDLRQVAWLCSDLAVLKEGRIREMGPTGQVLAHPTDSYTEKLLACTGQGPAKSYDGLLKNM